MAEPSTHINYSFEDIQRYLQGKMTAVEMHAIEKAALQDPFLADAIEGYADVKPTIAQQHLNYINAALIGKKEQSKVVAFNKKTQWLNIAAVIIVLAGIGVVAAYFMQSSNKQTQIAQVKNEPAKTELLKNSITTDNINTLSKQPDTNLLIAENKALKKVEPSLKRNGINKDAAANNIEEIKANVASVAAAPAATETSDNVMLSRSYMTATQPDSLQYALQGKVSGLTILPSTFSGKVVDENSKPISGVTIQSSDKKAAVLTDVNGNFSLQKNDTALNVVASTVGYSSEATRLQSGLNSPIVLKQANDNLNDVVVTTALGMSRKAKSLNYSTTSDSAKPIVGWKNFNNYVMTQLNKDTTAAFIINPGDLVEMEFFIDKLGNPYNITVTKSIDDAKNAKAIEILKNGPKWTNTSKKKKAKVTISF